MSSLFRIVIKRSIVIVLRIYIIMESGWVSFFFFFVCLSGFAWVFKIEVENYSGMVKMQLPLSVLNLKRKLANAFRSTSSNQV